MKAIILLLYLMFVSIPVSFPQDAVNVNSAEQYFTTDDYKRIPKTDVHCHIDTERCTFMEQAAEDNFRIISINTDASGNPPIGEQQRLALVQRNVCSPQLAYLTTFSMKGWEEDGWQDKTIAYIQESINMGALGIKVWKNIGMVEKDRNNRFIMIDDPKFDPVFDFLEKKGIPVCGHLGEPRNCWLPVEEMTVNNDKSYFREHPEYHMYLHPDYPSYDAQIQARDNLLKKHPGLIFIGVHLGSLEWSVDELAKRFETFPNMSVDLAARICHIQKQAQSDWSKVRDFFIRYQDRILYGTDQGDEGSSDPLQLKKDLHNTWLKDWEFFTTDHMMTSRDLDGEFKGLHLPRNVVEKIYNQNAARWLYQR